MGFFFGLIVCGLIGWAIGESRGRGLAGFIWGLVLGPLGWLVILIAPNLKKEKEEREKMEMMQRQFAMQKAQLEAIQKLQANPPSSVIPPPPGAPTAPKNEAIRVAKNGKDLGEIELFRVKVMLRNGQLAYSDYYFDAGVNDWVTLDCHSGLID